MRRPHAVASCALALGKPDWIRAEQAIRGGFLIAPPTSTVQPGRDEAVVSRDPGIGFLRAEMPVDDVEEETRNRGKPQDLVNPGAFRVRTTS
ncbi:hypothetical protein [Lentzea aerocolonigenes]|uniref:hypothetical protein n=1 Tax=Lentzea aerocolonigenes TaxID=68170 RepID=UPI000B226B6E|nr:hypothetical protein [Lentzea aerocolonigenes]